MNTMTLGQLRAALAAWSDLPDATPVLLHDDSGFASNLDSDLCETTVDNNGTSVRALIFLIPDDRENWEITAT